VYVQGASVYVQGASVYVQGASVYVQGASVYIPGKIGHEGYRNGVVGDTYKITEDFLFSFSLKII
jgi:hypothetical protein